MYSFYYKLYAHCLLFSINPAVTSLLLFYCDIRIIIGFIYYYVTNKVLRSGFFHFYIIHILCKNFGKLSYKTTYQTIVEIKCY